MLRHHLIAPAVLHLLPVLRLVVPPLLLEQVVLPVVYSVVPPLLSEQNVLPEVYSVVPLMSGQNVLPEVYSVVPPPLLEQNVLPKAYLGDASMELVQGVLMVEYPVVAPMEPVRDVLPEANSVASSAEQDLLSEVYSVAPQVKSLGVSVASSSEVAVKVDPA